MVEESKIEMALEAGLYAPSAANTQKTRLYVIRSLDLIAEVARNTSPWFQNSFPNVIIAVLFDLGKRDPQKLNFLTPHSSWSRFIWQDTACAMMNMILMAEALGLRTCWVSVIPDELGPYQENIRRALRVHPRYVLASLLFLGYSDEQVDVETAYHAGLPIKRNREECFLHDSVL